MTIRQQKIFERLLNTMRYDKAIIFCRSLSKHDAEALRSLALAYDQAATVARYNGKPYRRLAMLAMKTIEHCMRQDSGSSVFHIRGIIFLHAGNNEAAFKDFHRAYVLTPKAGYLVSLGNALRRLGRGEEALANYRKARRHAGLSGPVLAWDIAQVLHEMGKTAAARREAQHALRVAPKNAVERQVHQQLRTLLETL